MRTRRYRFKTLFVVVLFSESTRSVVSHVKRGRPGGKPLRGRLGARYQSKERSRNDSVDLDDQTTPTKPSVTKRLSKKAMKARDHRLEPTSTIFLNNSFMSHNNLYFVYVHRT